MAWNFSASKPIFQQIVERISTEILRGTYPPGTRIEAVRELAVTAGVNPNTVQRALTAVEESGLIVTRRGEGRYVTEDEAVLKRERERYVAETVRGFYRTMRELGLSDGEILAAAEKEITEKESKL